MKKAAVILLLFLTAATHFARVNGDDSIRWYRLRQKADSTVCFLQSRLLLVNPASPVGSELFHDYFKSVRMALRLPYDIYDFREERRWNKYLADMMVHFFVCCDDLPGRTCVAYDNLLARKNFFARQSGKGEGLAESWSEIAQRLTAQEAAIEVNDLKDELLIVKHGYDAPHGIEIDSLLSEAITQGLADEPLAIDRLYAADGPLSRLWTLMAPELRDVRTIYISGNFKYAQLNFGAIPIGGGLTLSDRYDVHQILSTASVGAGHSSGAAFRTATLFGGIDYESRGQASAAKPDNEPWNLVRGLPDSIRGGFRPLPWSMEETALVDSLLRSAHVQTQLFRGAQATEEAVRQMSGHAPDIIHLSTHGFMLAPLFTDSTVTEAAQDTLRYLTILSQSGLLFAGANKAWRGQMHQDGYDGILTSSELMKTDLSGCRLAVLPVCRGALGEDRNLTGMPFGVAYALKDAGVKQILCSLWSISDRATSVFMRYFYRHLVGSGTPAAALRQAVRDMRAAGYDSPYYSASFILVE